MRILPPFFFAAAAVVSVYAFVRPDPQTWSAVVKVLDETGQPVAGAEVVISYATPPKEGNASSWEKIIGLSDSNGVLSVTHTDSSIYLSFQARKPGYYPFGLEHNIGFSPKDHPERLVPKLTMVLKRVTKPTPMYAKAMRAPVPAVDKPVGYDLMLGDWIAPYGKGEHTDVLFAAQMEKRAENDSDYELKVTFPQNGDGIQPFFLPEVEKVQDGSGSGLRSPHEAPAKGYQPLWIQTKTRRPGQPTSTNRDNNRIYFFRVRTVLDEKGAVKSALYGKIYGDFMQFRYYLNPTPNDRNVEFDPKQNLLKGLKSTEQVSEP